MLRMEDKENEPQQEKASKLVVEPPVNQKPRRSVLKEFDPFAPDSPCPPREKTTEKIDEEDEIYEDAETSLRKFGILLIPDLRDNQRESKYPNCTLDLSYVEATESLSEVEGLDSCDKTSSEEDFEFNLKKHNENADNLVDNLDSNLLQISSDMDIASGLTDGNIMVDSLERMVDVSNRLNCTIGNIESPVISSKTNPIEAKEINVVRNISELSVNVESKVDVELSRINGNDPEELCSMIDSLELSDPQKNTPISDSAFGKNQQTLIDSLEILKSGEGLNTEETNEGTLSTIAKAPHEILADENHENVCSKSNGNLNETPSTDTNKSDISLFQNNENDTVNKNQKALELDSAFENVSTHTSDVKNSNKIITLSTTNSSKNVDDNKIYEVTTFDSIEYNADRLESDQINTPSGNIVLHNNFESLSSDVVESNTDQLQGDKIDASNGNADLSKISSEPVEYEADQLQHDKNNTSSVNVELNQTFESPSLKNVRSKTDQLQSNVASLNIDLNEIFESPSPNNDSVNIELNQTFESPSSNHVQSKTDKVQSDVPSLKMEPNETFEYPSPINVQSKTDQLQSDVPSLKIEPNETFVSLSSNIVQSKADQLQSDVPSLNIEPNKTFESPSPNNVQSKTDQLQSDVASVNIELNKTFDSPSSNNVQVKTDQLQSDVPSLKMEPNETFEYPSPINVQSKTDQLQSDVPSLTIEPNETFVSLSSNIVQSTADQLQSDVPSLNIEPNKTFESPSPNNVQSKTDQVQSDVPGLKMEPNETFEYPSPINVQSKTDQLQSDVPSLKIEPNETFESLSSNIVQSKTDQLQSDVPSLNIEPNETFESPSPTSAQSKTDQLQSDAASVNIELNETFESSSSHNIESKTDHHVQSDEISTSIVNVDISQTCHAFSSENAQSNTDQLQSDQTNNLEDNETFDGISLDNVQYKTHQLQCDQINTSHVNLEGNQALGGTSLDNVQFKSDQFQCDQINTSYVNVELNKTFETPSSNNDKSKTDQVNTCEHTEINVVERDSTADDKILNKTVDSQENTQYTKQNSTQIIDDLNQTEENLQQVESGVKKGEDCNTKMTAFNKTLETLPNARDTLIAENLNNQEVCIDTEVKKTSEVLGNIVEQTVESCKQESTSIFPQSTTSDSHNVQDRSVSLRDIDIDDTFKDDVGHDNIEQINSQRHSLPSNCSEESNSTFLTEEQAAESRRVIEVLAQSLNQTIDVEESAIADDINSSKSTNTSGELTEEKLNITIENVKESLIEHESIIGVKEDIESEEKVERKSIKTLERKATEEFEDLERQFNEKTKSTESFTEQELRDKTICIGEQCSKVFYRQDTREFEVLEREYSENAKNINDCDYIIGNISEAHIKNNEAREENIKDEEKSNDDKESKVINRHTQEFEDHKSDCTTNLQSSNLDDLKLNEVNTAQTLDVAANVEETYNKNANISEPGVEKSVNRDDLCIMPVIEHVKVRVSGNICNANSVSSKFEQVESKATLEEPIGINLKRNVNVKEDQNLDFKVKSVNNIAENTTDITVNDNEASTRTDPGVAKEVPNSTNFGNDQVARPNEGIVRTKYKPECRPSTRSLRNQTQVIDKPVVINNNDTSSKIEQENNDKSDQQLQKYKSKSEDLTKQVDKLQTEMNTVQDKNKRMDEFVLSCALNIEAERAKVIKLKKVLAEYELTLASQNEELRRLKNEEEKNTKSFTSLEMAFADIFEKYEKAKTVIGLYKKNEEILQRNIQCAEDQSTKLEAKCSVMKDQYTKKLNTVQEQMDQEKENYRQSMAKLQAQVKRLEIKSSSLETALMQKTGECEALAALCDDITGRPM